MIRRQCSLHIPCDESRLIAVADRKLDPEEVKEVLDVVVAKRAAGELRSPGAYFVTSIKRRMAAAGVPW